MQKTIKTALGEITGLEFENHLEFRGIKYAEAERWEYPTIIEKWDEPLDATSFGACSFQRRGFEDDAVCNPFYHREFRLGQKFTYSEDCLFLNIYAPKKADKLPVLVYIHGGSFTGGSADEQHLNGTRYAENGIVFVSFNYRLNAFGFSAHSSLVKDGVCGNWGLADQETALVWVLRHIADFGGDPENVTLIGQSAGAMSVDIQLSNPKFRNAFRRAILMSGAGLQRIVAKPLEIEKVDKFWENIAEKAGVMSVECLKDVGPRTLFYAWSDACRENPLSMFYTLPVRDGKIVTKLGFTKKTIPAIPLIVGVTKNDMMQPALGMLAGSFTKAAVKNGSHCWLYHFDRDLPGDDKGAWHSADLPYAFGTLDVSWRPFEETDRRISEMMIDSFTSFVKTGNPNCDSMPNWACGSENALQIK